MTKKNKKVLIIEDDEDFLCILQKKFSQEGFSVIVAKDGSEGLNAINEEKPDLIISDILLPQMDGIAIAKKLKESKNSPPIIFLTNVKDVDYTQKLKGFDCLMKSDLHIDDIVARAKEKIGLK